MPGCALAGPATLDGYTLCMRRAQYAYRRRFAEGLALFRSVARARPTHAGWRRADARSSTSSSAISVAGPAMRRRARRATSRCSQALRRAARSDEPRQARCADAALDRVFGLRRQRRRALCRSRGRAASARGRPDRRRRATNLSRDGAGATRRRDGAIPAFARLLKEPSETDGRRCCASIPISTRCAAIRASNGCSRKARRRSTDARARPR